MILGRFLFHLFSKETILEIKVIFKNFLSNFLLILLKQKEKEIEKQKMVLSEPRRYKLDSQKRLIVNTQLGYVLHQPVHNMHFELTGIEKSMEKK